MERVITRKIDPITAKIVNFLIPACLDPLDGLLPEEIREMVVANGEGKFSGTLMVQIGVMDRVTRSPIGLVYRQEITYQGFRRGRDVFIDPLELGKGVVNLVSEKRGLWVPAERLGIIIANN